MCIHTPQTESDFLKYTPNQGHSYIHSTTILCDLNNKKACISLWRSLHINMYVCALLWEGSRWVGRTNLGGKVGSYVQTGGCCAARRALALTQDHWFKPANSPPIISLRISMSDVGGDHLGLLLQL